MANLERHAQIHRVLRPLLIGAIALVCGCGSESADAPVGLYGGWKGQEDRVRTIHTYGNLTADLDEPPEPRTWNILDCGNRAMVEVALGCWLPAVLQPDGSHAFTSGAWCDSTAKGKTVRMVSLGGTFSRSGDGRKLTAKFKTEIQLVPSDGAYAEVTHTFEAETFYPGIARSCMEPPSAPPPIEDWSSLASCQTIAVRNGPVVERKVSVGESGPEPRCLEIAVGQSVVFEGDFAKWGARPGIAGNPNSGAAANPMHFLMGGTSATFPYPRPGDYLYYVLAPGNPVGLVRVR